MFVGGLWLPLASRRTLFHRELLGGPVSSSHWPSKRWPLSSEPTRLCFLSGALRPSRAMACDASIQPGVELWGILGPLFPRSSGLGSSLGRHLLLVVTKSPCKVDWKGED